jgi:dipeptidyl aminopeptidase/acylaminoacyl peptidase
VTTRPYGSWSSPLSADRIVEQSVSLGELRPGPTDLWWSELRPTEKGRVAIVRHRPGGETTEVLPEEFSARTRVHEYGGGAWWLHDDVVFFVDWSDQQLHRIDIESTPRVLSPATDSGPGSRFADGVVTPDSRWVICVHEDHAGTGEARNEIVAIDAYAGGEPVVLVSGPDLVSYPRVSPDGLWLCWTQWSHPRMPWDGTELWAARLDLSAGTPALHSPRWVAGSAEESVFQPLWAANGDLLFVSDRSNWWNLYRAVLDDETAPPTRLCDVDGEIGVPQWVFSQSRYAELSDGRILCAVAQGGLDRLAIVEEGSPLRFLDTPFTSFASLCAFGDGAAFVAAGPTTEPAVAVIDLGADAAQLEIAIVRPPRDLGLDPRWFSVPRPISYPTSGDANAHGLFYPPTNPDFDGPADESPPLVVLSHGGPTGAARPQLNLAIQYWTSRGIAVVDVNYRGSTGFGRDYRRALDGRWGIVDVDDCVAAARHLVTAGEADERRLAIRGGSAGGYTTLCALTFHDTFAAGASLYGVADLEALARDTHKFESRYLDTLVGPYPEQRDRYIERSPIHHTDRLRRPLIIFQGLEDEIVPPSQAEMMADALRAGGVPFAYLSFEGEQHGFRQAANIRRVLEAELYFYARIFGFDLDDDIEPVPIEFL